MKTKKKIVKNIKPKSYDINYEYICPLCGCNHWLTNIETKTKGFRVACDCGAILFPKVVKKIKIIYKTINVKSVKKTAKDTETTTKSSDIVLDKSIANSSCDTLEKYGFERSEALSLVEKAFAQIQVNDSVSLIKKALELLGAEKCDTH
jgi:formylmethanofuran dehydrogenase subunit B